MENCIFINIDSLLSNYYMYMNFERKNDEQFRFNDESFKILKEIIDESPMKVLVVLYSSWMFSSFSYPALSKKLVEYDIEIFGELDYSPSSRTREIQNFLKKYRNISSYVILDEHLEELEALKDNLIQLNFCNKLNINDKKRILRKLNVKPSD